MITCEPNILPCLAADALGVDLPQPQLGDVGGEVAKRRVLHGEHVVAVTLEHGVVHPEDMLVGPQPDAALVLATELVRRHQVRVDRLKHDLVPSGAVLGQVDPGVPALADQLDKVVVRVDIDLNKISIVLKAVAGTSFEFDNWT